MVPLMTTDLLKSRYAPLLLNTRRSNKQDTFLKHTPLHVAEVPLRRVLIHSVVQDIALPISHIQF